MPPKKKAHLMSDPKSVFVVTASTTKNEVPGDVRFARVDESVRILPDEMFENCDSLTEVVFEEGIQTIGKRAFANCSALTTVSLPSTLREILVDAFFSCSDLRSIELPLGLKVIGEYAFWQTSLLELEVPDSVETIGKRAFAWCKQLRSIILPQTLVMITEGLFDNCSRLRLVQFPSTIESIGPQAFYSCRALESIDLSHCTRCLTICSGAYRNCKHLSHVFFPPNLNAIEEGAFVFCNKLTHIRIPPNVASIGHEKSEEMNPFAKCPSLVSMEVSESLQFIDVLPTSSEKRGGIARCISLVNLFLPPFQEIHFCEDDVLQGNSQFQKVATGWRDLVPKLRDRFLDLPLHRLCYFHSYHPVDDTMQQLKDILIDNPNAFFERDTFGMTPLHILALAQKPVVELIQELPNFAEMALSSKDLFGSSPLDYLCKNPLREGIHATLRKILERKLPFLGLEQWKQELLEAEEEVRSAVDALNMSEKVKLLEIKLARLEILEILSLVEMVLWRIKLNENMTMGDAIETRNDREGCRVQSGSSIVITNALPYLLGKGGLAD